jgi:hypothetical protein
VIAKLIVHKKVGEVLWTANGAYSESAHISTVQNKEIDVKLEANLDFWTVKILQDRLSISAFVGWNSITNSGIESRHQVSGDQLQFAGDPYVAARWRQARIVEGTKPQSGTACSGYSLKRRPKVQPVFLF